MKILEILDSVVEWNYGQERSDYTSAHFTVGEYAYNVNIETFKLGVFNIDFTANRSSKGGKERLTSYSATDDGNQYVVFSTVKDIVEDFISNNEVRGFIFSAKGDSRIKLYDRFATMFQKSGFPKFKKIDDSGHVYYILAVDDRTIEIISSAL